MDNPEILGTETLEIFEPKRFTVQVRKVDGEDYITAEIENEIKRQLLNNDIYLKETKADKAIKVDAVLYASTWTGTDSPYSYPLQMEEATADNNIEILPPPGLTPEQYEQMEAAKITGGTQADGSITLLAYGDRPDIDLPVVILVRGD